MINDADLFEDRPSKSDLKNIQLLRRLVDPHCHVDEQSIYGQNEIVSMIQDPSISIGKWPTAKHTTSALTAFDKTTEFDRKIEFYEKESKKMINLYIKHMINKGEMSSYEDIVLNTNVVDISRIFKSKDKDSDAFSKTNEPYPVFNEELIDILRMHKWYAFIPCFNKMTIRLNRKRFMHVELIDICEKTKSMRIKLTDYLGDKYDWIACSFITYEMTFKDDNSMKFTYTDCHSYEEILTKNVHEMGWDKKQIQFWYDLFGLNDLKNMAILVVNGRQNKPFETVVFNMPDFNKIKRMFDMVDLSVKASGEKAVAEIRNNIAAERLEMYAKFIATINGELYTNAGVLKNDQIETEKITRVYNNTVVMTSLLDPVIPEAGYVPKPLSL